MTEQHIAAWLRTDSARWAAGEQLRLREAPSSMGWLATAANQRQKLDRLFVCLGSGGG